MHGCFCWGGCDDDKVVGLLQLLDFSVGFAEFVSFGVGCVSICRFDDWTE